MHERTSTAELQRGGRVCPSVDRWALSAEQLVLGRRLVEEQRKGARCCQDAEAGSPPMSPAADGARARGAPGIPSAFSESAAVRGLLHTGLLEQFGLKFLAAGYEGSAPVIRPGSSARFGDAGPRRPRCPAAPQRPAGRCVGLRASRCRRAGRRARSGSARRARPAPRPSNAVSRARSAATGHRCRGSAGGRAARAPAHPRPRIRCRSRPGPSQATSPLQHGRDPIGPAQALQPG
jgi:hypothetical protein